MNNFSRWSEPDDLPGDVQALESALRQYMALKLSGSESEKMKRLEDSARELLPKVLQQQATRRRIMTSHTLEDIGKKTSDSVMAGMHSYRSDLSSTAADFGLPEFDGVFREERRYYQAMAAALEGVLKVRGIEVEPLRVEDPTEKTLSEWQSKKKAVLRLERERDEELAASPEEMHPQIKRMFRKAIDAILDN
jgi:hypothetical protein